MSTSHDQLMVSASHDHLLAHSFYILPHQPRAVSASSDSFSGTGCMSDPKPKTNTYTMKNHAQLKTCNPSWQANFNHKSVIFVKQVLISL